MLKRALTDWLMIVFLCFFFSTALSLPAIAQPPKQPAEGAERADEAGEDPGEKSPAASEKKLDTTTVGIGGGVLAVLTILFGLTSIWVKKDSLRYGIGSKKWTRIVVVPYALGAVAIAVSVGLNWTEYAFLESGGLWGALGGLSAVWLVPVFIYVIARSRALNDTGEVEAAPPDVVLIATCREVPEENTLLVEKLSENSEFADLVRVLAEAFATRAPVVLLDLAQGGLHVRYDIDGTKVPTRIREHLLNGRKLRKNDPEVWIDAPPLDAVTGEKVLVTLMRLAGLSPKKRGRPQNGEFEVTVDGKKRTCRLSAKVIKGHEQFAVDLAEPPKKFKAADALGMPSEMLESLQDLVNKKHGLFIVSASKGNGLSTLFDMTVTAGDRLMRDFVSIEEKKENNEEIQNIKIQKYDAESGESPIQAVERAMLSYPSGFVTRNLRDPAFAKELVKRAIEDKMVIVSIPAEDSIDAISKIIDLGISPSDLAKCLVGSVSQKLVRKLCPKCADHQETPLPLLEKFGRSTEDVPHIRTASEHGGCRVCSGRGYAGRIGAFELASGVT
ncbi:MAG: Flp pilus assembly complex ATPase component TadA, partial [Pirellulales bacterium]|nr:Flp pilus assembly complex ATPase component TadA [Pirellulales bacterium]